MAGRKMLVVLVCLVLAAPAALAEKVEVKAKGKVDGPGGAFGWFGPGLSFVDYGPLNQKLTGYGFPEELGGNQWTFGGGGLAMANRVLIGGSGFGGEQTVTGSPEGSPRVIDVEFSGGQFDIGYAVFARKHLIVAPMLGIGATGYDLTLTYRSGDDTLGGLFGAGGRETRLAYEQFSLTPQVMVAVPVSFAGIILRGGVVVSPASAKWEFEDGGRLLDGPEMSKLTPFVGLNVMFGGLDQGGKSKTKVKVIKKVERDDDSDDSDDDDDYDDDEDDEDEDEEDEDEDEEDEEDDD